MGSGMSSPSKRPPKRRKNDRLSASLNFLNLFRRGAAAARRRRPSAGRRGALSARHSSRSAPMTDLSQFPITRRWPAEHPERLQLYSLNTPNGVKVSIMLEETGLAYEPHLVDITKNETWIPEFLSLNPNGKIPAILDPDGPGGEPLAL